MAKEGTTAGLARAVCAGIVAAPVAAAVMTATVIVPVSDASLSAELSAEPRFGVVSALQMPRGLSLRDAMSGPRQAAGPCCSGGSSEACMRRMLGAGGFGIRG